MSEVPLYTVDHVLTSKSTPKGSASTMPQTTAVLAPPPPTLTFEYSEYSKDSASFVTRFIGADSRKIGIKLPNNQRQPEPCTSSRM